MTRRPSRGQEPPATELEMTDLLERMLAKPGNGGSGEYAFLRQVRNAAGFDASRTFDAVSVGLWPSRGHEIHVYEIKVSRGDWQRELAKPAKAEDAAKVADRFSIVAPRGCVNVDEIPATWGYIEASGAVAEEVEEPHPWKAGETLNVLHITGRKLRTVKAAPLLHPDRSERPPIARSFLVPLLRAAGAVPEAVTPAQAVIDRAIREAVERAVALERERAAADRAAIERDHEKTERFLQLARVHVPFGDAAIEAKAQEIRLALASKAWPESVATRLRQLSAEIERFERQMRTVRSGIVQAMTELNGDEQDTADPAV